jgi:hypothetical protein
VSPGGSAGLMPRARISLKSASTSSTTIQRGPAAAEWRGKWRVRVASGKWKKKSGPRFFTCHLPLALATSTCH